MLDTAARGAATSALVERAPAKVNLFLRVVGRRIDGYHALDSLVMFAGMGDSLRLTPGEGLSLTTSGPFADTTGAVDDNLVLRAARALAALVPGLRAGSFHLTKRLPTAAGLGGGSADAAAALRLLARLNGLAAAHPALAQAALETGSDVPVCLTGSARMMRGRGEEIGPPLALGPLFCVLVNPGVPVPTAGVFAALKIRPGGNGPSHDRPPTPDAFADRAALLSFLAQEPNDLEPPARALAPEIDAALASLAATPACRLARMSGSGATVFALYDTCHTAAQAARTLRAAHPAWWVKSTVLR